MKYKEKKKDIIESGLFGYYTTERRKMALNGQFGEMDSNESYGYGMTEEQTYLCEMIRKARYEQIKKIEDHINYLFNKWTCHLYFVTLTFDDRAMALKPQTRRKNVIKILNQFEDYIVNIDYGTKNEREHYHAIVAIDHHTKEMYKDGKFMKCQLLDKYRLGFYSMEPIRTEDKDKKRLSRYINKLTLHSIKVKQTYVSVKKGSDYQLWKEEKEHIKELARTSFQYWKNETQKYDYLESLEM